MPQTKEIPRLSTSEMDEIVFETIKQNPGSTSRQIRLILEDDPRGIFKESFLINSLKRLEEEQRRIVKRAKKEFEHGKIVRKYFVRDEDSEFQFHLKLGKDILEEIIEYNSNQRIFAFATGKKTIAIALENNEYYKKTAKFYESLEKMEENDLVKLRFPDVFVEFYGLIPHSYSIQYLPPDENKAIRIEIIENVESQKDYEPKKTKRILILEDEEDYCEDLVTRLEDEGHIVEYAKDITSFLEKLEKKSFDFVSIDKRIVSETDEKNIAGKMFFEVLKACPNAEVGLLTNKLEKSEEDYFTKLGFKTILRKKEKRTGDQLVKILRAL
ncbi:MAG: hypothetical protein K5785_06270 [Nitrosarchaeum sp.]|nr:hypothetical protein [Nitrosarchaeum sp.]